MKIRSHYPGLFLALTLLLGACDKDSDKAPKFKLTEEQKQWSRPYQDNVVWKFDANLGYQRSYRTGAFGTQDLGINDGNSSGPRYFREVQSALLLRTDSAYQAGSSPVYKFNMNFQLGAEVEASKRLYNERFEGLLLWHNASVRLPLAQLLNNEALPTGWTLHPTYTVAGVTYTNVLEYVPTSWVAQPAAAYDAVQIFYTREVGVLRFKERGGTVWTRY